MSRVRLPKITSKWLIVIGVIAVAGIAGYVGSWLQSKHEANSLATNTSAQKKIVTSESALISQIAKTVGPSVVSVNVEITDATTDFFGNSQSAQGAGTGIIISTSGIIVTNRHVVPSGTTKVSVTLSDGTEFKDVSVLGRTSESDSIDAAFLKINDTQGHKLVAAKLGDSGKTQVGDNVVAIGNALGQFQNTVTSGIISGYGRSIQAGDGTGQSSTTESLINLFQTDAAINQGNSGGPLVNMNGQVIGINTAVAAGDAQNIGFAIPINDVSGMINQVLETGKFARPYLGIRYIPLSPDVANQLDLTLTSGAYISESADPNSPSIIPDGPADKAGLKQRDIITAINNTKIDQSHSLSSLLGTHQPGDKIKLTIVRDGKTLHINATLGALPSS